MIVVPFTKLHDATRDAVPEARFVLVDDRDGYRKLLRDLWENGEAFTLVEHDVVPTRDQLDALEACPDPWCFYGYHPGHWIPVFGCVRFSAALIAGTEGVWNDPSWPWSQLDARFAAYARSLGWKPHWHYPHVRHEGAEINDEHGARRAELPLPLREWLIDREVSALRELAKGRT